LRTSKTPTTTPVSRQKRSKKESEREITNKDLDSSDIIDVTPKSKTLLESPCKYSSCFYFLQKIKKKQTFNSIATDYEPPKKVRRSIRNEIVQSKTSRK
jgi:hypothetical protein